MQNYVIIGREGVTSPTYKFLGPLHISGPVDARKFKFGTRIGHRLS